MPPSTTMPPAAPVLPAGADRTTAPPRAKSGAPEETCHTLLMDIESYSDAKKLPNGNCIKSPKIDAGGCSWYIFFYPNGLAPLATGVMSLYLQLAAEDGGADAVEARFQFMLVDQFGGVSYKSVWVSRTIHAGTNMHGFRGFVRHVDLEQSSSFHDGPFKIRCDVTVLEKTKRREAPSVAAKPKAPAPPPVSGLHADISRLLVAEEGKDVDFEVGGKMFAAHRCVLAARSSVFKADLFGSAKDENTSYVRISDIIPEAFDALLHFIYTDSLPEMDAREVELMAQHLLVAAERYDLKDLKSIMESKLCGHVGVATALHSLVLAEQHKCAKLKKRCLDFIAAGHNASQVMEADGAEHLVNTCPSVVRDLVNKILVTPRSRLSLAKIVFYVAVCTGILNLDSVALLKLCSVVLVALLVLVRYHG